MESNNKQGNAEQQPKAVRVMQLLHITARQYDAYKIRCGRSFLQNLLHHYPQQLDEILANKNYWDWWEVHYQLRDNIFLNAENLDCINVEILGAMYTAVHHPYSLPAELILDTDFFAGFTFMIKPAI